MILSVAVGLRMRACSEELRTEKAQRGRVRGGSVVVLDRRVVVVQADEVEPERTWLRAPRVDAWSGPTGFAVSLGGVSSSEAGGSGASTAVWTFFGATRF